MRRVTQDGWALGSASDRLRDDSDIVRAAVEQNGLHLQYAPAFQDNLEIVRAAVEQNTRIDTPVRNYAAMTIVF